MKILAIADIHGRTNFKKELISVISDVDLILIAGDITNFGDSNAAEQILDEFLILNTNLLAVPGNCDQTGVNNKLIDKKINLHNTIRQYENAVFYGIGGCVQTPFSTPQEYTEKELEKLTISYKHKATGLFNILVSHCPPYNTKLDRTFSGFHAGSKTIRNFIEKFKPDLVLCGHIHEAIGVDKINNTIIINPGPFPKNYAIIMLSDKIEYELYAR